MTSLATTPLTERSSLIAGAASLLGGLACGSLVALGGPPVAALCAAVAIATCALAVRSALPVVTIAVLTATITGFAVLGRGFAYLGIGPVFVGEVVLAWSLLALALSRGMRVPLRSPIVWLYLAFAAWGAVLAAGDVGTHGIDTLRDSAIWYYGLFMLVGAWLFADRHRITGAVRWVAIVTPWLLAWIPIAFALTMWFEDVLPTTPLRDVPLIVFKGGDMSVFLALALAFVIFCRTRVWPFHQRWPAWSLWILGIADFLVIAAKNRGGMLAVMLALTIALVITPRLRVVHGVAVAAAMVSLVAVLDVNATLDDGRELSVVQLQQNMASVASHGSYGTGHGTAGWRLSFWRDITADTFHGQRFWTGHGFGLNLADHYGYQANEDGSLRSPHSSWMTVLARMGVPGLAIWVGFNLAYAGALLRALLVARREEDPFWERVFVLLLVHWTAATVTASFDPYLEGPQGAIVFWLALGIGVGALHAFGGRARSAA